MIAGLGGPETVAIALHKALNYTTGIFTFKKLA